VEFVIEPTVRFGGEPGEQATMFFLDPSGKALEIKATASPFSSSNQTAVGLRDADAGNAVLPHYLRHVSAIIPLSQS
jgi:hypothetical protein